MYFGFIYKWTDSTNGKTYTGSHVGTIYDGYTGSGTLFKRAYKKRSETFTKEILEYVYEENKNILLEREQKYLNQINWNNTYNISTIARGSDGAKGKPKSEEWKRQHSEKMKGRTSPKKGIKTGPESEETRQRKSKSLKGNTNSKGNIPWNKGLKMTEEYNEKCVRPGTKKREERYKIEGHPLIGKLKGPWSHARRDAYEKGRIKYDR